MSARVTDSDQGLRELLARVRQMSGGGRSVRVGVLGDAPKETPADAAEKGIRGRDAKRRRVREKAAKRVAERVAGGERPYSLLEVAIVHEFGGGKVPARSFIRATIDERRADILKLQVALAKQVLSGKSTHQQALDQLGAKVASMVQARIVAGIAPPLAASTLKRKKRKTTPLILMGQLKSSITWAVGAAA